MEVVTESRDISHGFWPKLLNITGRDTFTVWVTVPFIFTTALYWTIGGLYLLMDITKKPAFLQKFKIQPGTNEPLDSEKLSTLIKTVLFNQFCVNLPMAIAVWVLMKDRLRPEELAIFPSLGRILTDLVVYVLLQEIGFYYIHRLLHHRLLYKFIHKKHHEWTSPIAISAIYCHPFEHAFCNLPPQYLGLILMGSHPVTAWVWFSVTVLANLNDHSDYNFPLLPSPEAHDFHHQKFNNCFGIMGLMDWLHGTDKMFKASRAFEPHKSQRERFPDIAKRSL